MRHKHYDLVLALIEGNHLEFLDPVYGWGEPQDYAHVNPISFPDYEWRIKKEPVITVRYFRGQSDKNWNGMYVEIKPDLEKWDLKITYQDGKAIKAEVAE